MAFYIHVQETPNPDAVKFISQYAVKSAGKSNYGEASEATHNPLATRLFVIEGVKSLFFFDNYVTVTRDPDADWGPVGELVLELLQRELPEHDPSQQELWFHNGCRTNWHAPRASPTPTCGRASTRSSRRLQREKYARSRLTSPGPKPRRQESGG